MTVLKDVLDARKETYSSFEDFVRDMTSPRRSISTWGKDGVLQFRVITSNTLSMETSSTIASGLEKHYAGLVEIIVNLNSISKDATTPEEFIRNIHANDGREFQVVKLINDLKESTINLPDINSDIVREQVNLDFKNRIKPIKTMENTISKDKRLYVQNVTEDKCAELETIIETEECEFLKLIDLKDKSINEEVKSLIVQSMDDTSDYYCHENSIVKYEKSSDMFSVIIPLVIGENTITFLTYPRMSTCREGNIKGLIKDTRNISENNRSLLEEYNSGLNYGILNEATPSAGVGKYPGGSGTTALKGKTPAKGDLSIGNIALNVDAKLPNSGGDGPTNRPLPASKVSDREIKKANELMPTMLDLSVVFKDEATKTATQVNFTVGVKCVLHAVDSEEMVKNLISAAKNKGKVFQFLRWTTGEISLVKDLLLGMDSLKDDAINMARRHKNRWWTALKRLKGKRAIGRLTGDSVLATASLVVNMAEVDYIKNTENIDLMDPLKVRKIMLERMLLAFVVVEEDTETCHILFDSEVDFTPVSFAALKRMPKDTETRDLIKMMARM